MQTEIYSLEREHESKPLKRETLLRVKELILIDKYTPSITFWSQLFFFLILINTALSELSLGPLSAAH